MLFAAFIVGTWISNRIESAVVENSAISAALFMESYIAPLSQELADEEALSDPSRTALRELFLGTALGERVVSYKIWAEGGRIVEASNSELLGKVFPKSNDQIAAWHGNISASFEDLDDLEDEAEAALGIPILEVYSPVRNAWNNEVVAVAEFYERADNLAQEIKTARRLSWLIVAAVFGCSAALLTGIVAAGSRTIELQKASLAKQLSETISISEQNRKLKDRISEAAQRSTEHTEHVMQRIGHDLHDGVAQHLSLASLRFEEAKPKNKENADTVRSALKTALKELRAISRGLALPDLAELTNRQVVERAVLDHQKAFGGKIAFNVFDKSETDLSYSLKLCVYRFVQEMLANSSKHAKANSTTVNVKINQTGIVVKVKDDGVGFSSKNLKTTNENSGQGLRGMRDRAATLGGEIKISSSAKKGTTVELSIPNSKDST